MKKTCIALFSLILLVSSCEEKQVAKNSVTDQSHKSLITKSDKTYANFRDGSTITSYKGVLVSIPSKYPQGVLDFTVEDFESVALNTYKTGFHKVSHIKGETLSEIFKATYEVYPDMNEFKVEEYRQLLPHLTDKEIIVNSEVILDYVEKLMAFDIASAFSQLNDAPFSISDFLESERKGRRSPSLQGFLNGACVVSVVIAHPRLGIGGLLNAKSLAENFSVQKAPVSLGDQDALRHGYWIVFMGKYGAYRYGNPNRAASIVEDIAWAHECAHFGLGSKVDKHNNKVSSSYYRANVNQTGSWPNRNSTVSKSDNTIANEVAAYNIYFVQNDYQISNYNTVDQLVKSEQ